MSRASVTDWLLLSSLWNRKKKRKQVRVKVKLKCTWHCGRRSSQQDPVCVRRTRSSKAEHSELRGDDSSPQTPKTKTWDRISVSLLYVQSFLSSQLVLLQVKSSFCLPSTLPSIPLFTESRLVAPVQPERSKPPGFLFPFPGEVRATSFYSARHRAF